MVEPTLSPFEWALQHLQVVGWPTLVLIAWKLRGTIDKLVTNHFAHMEKDIAVMCIDHKDMLAEQRRANEILAEIKGAVSVR